MTLARWIDLKAIRDTRGLLVVAEALQSIPFDIKRIYFLRDLKPDAPRGFHAHKRLEQVAVCVAGACSFILDNGRSREAVRCESPAKGLYVGPMVWHEMHDFSPGCIILMLASDVYDETDYIRDIVEFRGVTA